LKEKRAIQRESSKEPKGKKVKKNLISKKRKKRALPPNEIGFSALERITNFGSSSQWKE